MKRGVELACFLALSCRLSPLTTQIRDDVAVIHPVHQQRTVAFLLSLGESLRKDRS